MRGGAAPGAIGGGVGARVMQLDELVKLSLAVVVEVRVVVICSGLFGVIREDHINKLPIKQPTVSWCRHVPCNLEYPDPDGYGLRACRWTVGVCWVGEAPRRWAN